LPALKCYEERRGGFKRRGGHVVEPFFSMNHNEILYGLQ